MILNRQYSSSGNGGGYFFAAFSDRSVHILLRGDSMVYSFNDIRCKEIINVRNGCRIGFPDDIEFDSCTAKICRLVVFGRAKFFGLFGREEDICIKWCDIEVIGEDTILVSCDASSISPRKKGKLFGNLLK